MNTYFDEESSEKEVLSKLHHNLSFRIQVQNRLCGIMKTFGVPTGQWIPASDLMTILDHMQITRVWVTHSWQKNADDVQCKHGPASYAAS
jgi:hypothetical protein